MLQAINSPDGVLFLIFVLHLYPIPTFPTQIYLYFVCIIFKNVRQKGRHRQDKLIVLEKTEVSL